MLSRNVSQNHRQEKVLNTTPPESSLAPTPTLAVLGFKRQLVYHLHFWAFVAVAPLDET